MDEEKKIKEFITENKFWIKCAGVLIAVLLIFFGGFYAGRTIGIRNMKPEVIVKYEKGDTITVTVDNPVPYEVIQPIDTTNFIAGLISSGVYQELFPDKDTVYVHVPVKEDSTAVIKDYELKRIYNEVFFDNDTMGKFTFHGEVQYNRLRYYGYSYSPVYKTVTETHYIEKKFSPYVGGGISTAPSFIAQGGMFFDEKYGFGFQYNYDWYQKKNDFGFIFMYKF